MKRILFSVLAVLAFSQVRADVEINDVNFPDAAFRTIVSAKAIDADRNGTLSDEEIANVTKITASGKSITSLKGIEFFTALQELVCYNNQLTTLDLSKNTGLISLSVYRNQIKGEAMDAMIASLPTASEGKLLVKYTTDSSEKNICTPEQVAAAKAKGWSVYDSGNKEFAGVKILGNIDASLFPDANFLDFLVNSAKIDVNSDGILVETEATKPTSLKPTEKGISNLKGIELFTAITTLDCSGNQLTALDLSANTKLTAVYCYNNQIKGEAMDALIASLPTVSGSKDFRVIDSTNDGEGNTCNEAQVNAAKEKGWAAKYKVGSSFTAYSGIMPTVITEELFPDANFRAFVSSKSVDKNQDGKLSDTELGTTSLDVSGKEIANLKGIELFTKLTSLNCSNNQLTALDLSKNTALKTLNCYKNQLTALDLTANASLTSINCYSNQIKGEAMDALIVSLPTVSSTYNFRVIDSTNDGEGNGCNETQVKAIKEKGWVAQYKVGTEFTEYSGIMPIAITEELFPDANFRAYISSNTVDTNQDGKLAVTEINSKTYLDVSGKEIASLKGVELFTRLTTLNCSSNQLTALDVSQNIALTSLDLSKNQLSSLDVSQNIALTSLNCSSNLLTSLDLTKNTELNTLNCYENKLTTLDLSANTKLSIIYCYSNQIKTEAMDALIASLPTVSGYCYFRVIDSTNDDEGNTCNETQVSAIKEKGWTAQYKVGTSFTAYSGIMPIVITEELFPDANFHAFVSGSSVDTNQDGKLAITEINNKTSLDVSGKEFASLKGIEVFTKLTSLNCSNNQLTAIDLSKNTALITLNISKNQLSSLDLSQNTALSTLDCSDNLLTSLDLSQNTALTTLACNNNKLSSLDLSQNTALSTLDCSDNLLTTLDLSQNTAVNRVTCSNNSLTALDLSKNTTLSSLICYKNQIKEDKMNKLVSSLPTVTDGSLVVYSQKEKAEDEGDGNQITYELAKATNDKGWKTYYIQAGNGYRTEIAEEDSPTEVTIDGLKYRLDKIFLTASVVNDESYDSMTSVVVPGTVSNENVTYSVNIGDKAFRLHASIKTIILSEGIETIGKYAFYGTGITTLLLPSTLKNLTSDAFRDVHSYSILGPLAVVSKAEEPISLEENTFSLFASISTLYVPEGSKTKYEAAQGWSAFSAIEEGLFAEELIDGFRYLLSTESKTATVVQDYNYAKMESVVIPATTNYKGVNYQVTAIGNNAFYNRPISEIQIPSSIKTIGDRAFSMCSYLKVLIIPEGVESIGIGAFANNSNADYLTKLELPSSLKNIGEGVIAGRSDQLSVISRIVEPFEISDKAFANTVWNNQENKYMYEPHVATLYVPIGTKSKYEALSGWKMFANIEEGEVREAKAGNLLYSYSTGSKKATVISDDSYKDLTEVTIPSEVTIEGESYHVTAIGKKAFASCEKITSFSLPNGLVTIGESAFSGTRNTSITLPEGIVSIGDRAFASTSITDIILPRSLVTIGSYAFSSNNAIKELVIPEGVESIGTGAFNSMTSLKQLELPTTLKSIGTRVIYNCNNLTAVVSNLTEPFAISDETFMLSSTWNSETGKYDLTPSPATLYIPEGARSKYEVLSGWTYFANIEEGVLKEAMVGNLKYSYAGGSATVINDESYQELTKVEVPTSVEIDGTTYQVKAIGNSAFKNCNKLESITLSEGIVTIGNYAFEGCYYLQSVTLPEGIVTIGNYAFEGCYRLQSVNLPEGIETIGISAFSSTALTEIKLPSSLRKIDDNALWSSKISILIIPEGVVTIGDAAFAFMDELTRIELPSSLKSIGQRVFLDDNHLKAVISKSDNPIKVNEYTFGNNVNYNSETQTYDNLPLPATLYIPSGSKDKYVAAGWTLFTDIDDSELKETMVGSLKYLYSTGGSKATVIYDESYRQLQEVTVPARVTLDGKSYPVTEISYRAFQSCNKITSITLTDNLETIGDYAFNNCSGVKSLVIPEGVKIIGHRAFSYMSKLTTLELPASLKSIGYYVISGDNSLTTVTSHLTAPFEVDNNTFSVKSTWNSETNTEEYTPSPATLYVPAGKKSQYEATAGWNMFAKIEEISSDGIIIGDVNGDKKVNAADIVEFVNYLKGNASDRFVLDAADVDGNGTVDKADITAIEKIIMAGK